MESATGNIDAHADAAVAECTCTRGICADEIAGDDVTVRPTDDDAKKGIAADDVARSGPPCR